MRNTPSRSVRSLVNSAYSQLGQAESAWVRFTQLLEALAALHHDETSGFAAREVGETMHKFRKVLDTWTQD